jgi:hypothetical protein
MNSVMHSEFHKVPGNSQVATQLVASQVVLSSIELVSRLQIMTHNKQHSFPYH